MEEIVAALMACIHVLEQGEPVVYTQHFKKTHRTPPVDIKMCAVCRDMPEEKATPDLLRLVDTDCFQEVQHGVG